MEQDPELHNRRGVLLSNQGKYQEAFEAFELSIQLNPEVSLYHYNLAQMAMALGLEERARQAFALYEEYKKGRCPYFPNRKVDRHEHLPLIQQPSEEDFEALLAKGFRRKFENLARNVCLTCSSCVQNRTRIQEFIPSKSQKKVLKKNSDLKLELKPAREYDARQHLLYSQYVQNRHKWKDEDYTSHLEMIHESSNRSLMFSWYLEGELVMVGVSDAAGKSLYASECYYNTAYKDRSLGIFNILSLIKYGKEQGFEYLYLGEYIEELPSMRYKMAFGPQEIFVKGRWVPRYIMLDTRGNPL